MPVPSYRKHISGQARVTLRGKDYLLGPYGSPESREADGRLIAEYTASGRSRSFGKASDSLLMEEVLLAYIKHARVYYDGSSEFKNMQTVVRALTDLYASHPRAKFGAAELQMKEAEIDRYTVVAARRKPSGDTDAKAQFE